jgi:hypothetical protein
MKNRISLTGLYVLTAFIFFYIPANAEVLKIQKSIQPAIASLGDVVQVCITMNPIGVTPKADIMWLIDNTGSMSGGINNIRNNINNFTSQLASYGIDYRNGLVTFKDVPEITNSCFAANDAQFLSWISAITASGGLSRIRP